MLSVTNLSAHYLEQQIFAGLSFALQAGECLHLKGANGAGKSTLLKMIAGLKVPAEGLINIDPFYHCVFLGHNLGLMESLTVEQNINFYDDLYDNEVALEDIQARYELKSIWQKPVRTLSRGQQQRVAFSRLSMTEAHSIWLLDEPLTGLDQHFQTQFFNLLQWHLNREGAVIIASHLQTLPIQHQKMRLAA